MARNSICVRASASNIRHSRPDRLPAVQEDLERPPICSPADNQQTLVQKRYISGLTRESPRSRSMGFPMERFIARENIRRFKAQLADCSDEKRSATLRNLLAEEEAHLARLEHPNEETA